MCPVIHCRCALLRVTTVILSGDRSPRGAGWPEVLQHPDCQKSSAVPPLPHTPCPCFRTLRRGATKSSGLLASLPTPAVGSQGAACSSKGWGHRPDHQAPPRVQNPPCIIGTGISHSHSSYPMVLPPPLQDNKVTDEGDLGPP